MLRKRIIRSLRRNLLRYLALGMLIFVSIYMVVSVLGASETLISGVSETEQQCQVEDGQFTVFTPLTKDEVQQIIDTGTVLEAHFFLDYSIEDGSRLRLFAPRQDIDRFLADAGKEEAGTGEILLEKRYAQEHHLQTGDMLHIAGTSLRVAGIGTLPDYNNPVKGMTDSTADSRFFGLGIVDAQTYDAFKESRQALEAETYTYAYRFQKSPDDSSASASSAGSASVTIDRDPDRELRELIESFPFDEDAVPDPFFQEYLEDVRGDASFLADLLDSPLFSGQKDMERLKKLIDPDIHNLQEFVPAKDNMRIEASTDDLLVNRYAMSAAGVIIILLFSYVLAVFTMHEIDESSEVIGTLYALGIRRRELALHFTLLPVFITFLFGLMGLAVGYSSLGIPFQMMDTYNYYSVPDMSPRLIPYILVYGILMPPFLSFLINWTVILHRLDRPVLALLRKERRRRRSAGVRLSSGHFTRNFRIRQMLRSIRPALTVVAGLFVSLLIVFIGIDCYYMCRNIQVSNKEDTKFAYMYLYKYPEKKVPEGGTAAYARSLSRQSFGFEIEVTLLGIEQDMPYFDAHPSRGQGSVSISSAMAQKYGIKEGDVVTLWDGEEERYYAFAVEEIVQYSPGFYAFMDLDAMRDLMDVDEDYYNVVFSDQELDIDPGRLYSVLSRSSIAEASDVYINMLGSMIYTLLGLSAVIFLVVMYLMMGVMVDYCAYDISLMKIFGYRDRELRSLYLSGNIFLLAAGTLAAIPLAKVIIDHLYPIFISNVACAMDLSMPPLVYAVLYFAVMLCCLGDYYLLTFRIRRVVPAQVLKAGE